MTAGWRLALCMLSWAAAVPLFSLGLRFLDQHRILQMSGSVVAIHALALLVWAAWIYVRCVPAAPGILRCFAFLAAFLIAMALLGAAAVWLTFWLIVAIYGV